jgi:hypothetical protein
VPPENRGPPPTQNPPIATIPFYRRWAFWVLVALFFVGIATLAVAVPGYFKFMWSSWVLSFTFARGAWELIALGITVGAATVLKWLIGKAFPELVKKVEDIPCLRTERGRTITTMVIASFVYISTVGPYLMYAGRGAQVEQLTSQNKTLAGDLEAEKKKPLTFKMEDQELRKRFSEATNELADITKDYRATKSNLAKAEMKIAGLDPRRQIIASVSATATVWVKTTTNIVNSHYMDANSTIALGRGTNASLITLSEGTHGVSERGGETTWYATGSAMDSSVNMGKPISNLLEADHILVKYPGVMGKENSVLRGTVSFILNNSIRLNFQVPPQESKDGVVLITGINKQIRENIE